ncbi:MAG: cyclase family protein [Betaproteobacteria bacterium]|nr:MAG: cyclase family protein [Betaproteobacteria bacterium]
MSERWKKRPPGSNWGEFGPDDERGRMNLITPAKVLQGVAEVKTGTRFCLSLPLDYPGGNKINPRRRPPRRFATDRAGRANFNFLLSGENSRHTDVVCDDGVLLWLQYSTQWDSLAHIGSQFDADGDGVAETVFYNGWRAGDDIVAPQHNQVSPWGCFEGSEARRLGIENMAESCVQGRAVMIDLNAHFGRCRKAVGYEELMRVMEADKVEVEQGDMACFYTGWGDVIMEMGGEVDLQKLDAAYLGLDGRDDRLLQWISDSGVAALISDNYAVELLPAPERPGRHPAMPLHEHCLFKLGVHLGEIWYLSELAQWLRAHGRNRFLLTAPPLRLPGAVGSPATPVATV